MLYSKYKAHRTPTPDTVVQALQYLKASVKALSIKVIEVNLVVSIVASIGTVELFMAAYSSNFQIF
jgi:5'-3' exonuclease